LLESCYRNCLDVAARNGVESVAFCCISTGVFRFPPERAAQIAVDTVLEWKRRTQSPMKVVFNVFSEKDEAIYARIFEKFNG
jgi:Predicted phosphatase homologous to the C-terminal domain of histone macroH2A1